MSKLAIFGGEPIVKKEYPDYITVGEEELEAVKRVIKKGHLSYFYGSNHPRFYGGPEVKAFEKEWREKFGFKYAVSMNSATSGLYAAVAALEIGPGDEVIISPYTMCCNATAVLMYGAIPVFADIEEETFGLDPKSIEKLISPNTKAIIVTHLMGHIARIDEISAIAKKHNIKIIEDAAQVLGAADKGRFAGVFGDIGVFSLNCHKTINTGEGGVCVTEDDELAKRLQLIRNHAEVVIEGGFKIKSLVNMLGHNWRLGELEAAIGREQLKKLDKLNQGRIELAGCLNEKLEKLPGIIPPAVREDCRHVWYAYCPRIDPKIIKVSRNLFAKALMAEGVPFEPGFEEPLYLLPLFQQKTAIGRQGYPFTLPENKNLRQQYQKGTCPVCERIEYRELLQCEQIRSPLTKKDMQDMASGFEKVLENLEELARIDGGKEEELPPDAAGRRAFFKKKIKNINN